jgi:SAM-dependent MidA family methyltransferase
MLYVLALTRCSAEMRLKQKEKLQCSGTPTLEDGEEGTRAMDGIPIVWHSFFAEVPKTHPIIVIGQEFIDAFPIHQFEYTGTP